MNIEKDKLGLDGSYTQVVKVFAPPTRETGKIIDGSDPVKAAEQLITFLKETKLIKFKVDWLIMLEINEENCTGCKICEKVCPFGAIIVDPDDKKAKVLDTCTLCGSCINACRFDALNIERKAFSKEELEKYSGIIIWGELEKIYYNFVCVCFDFLIMMILHWIAFILKQ